MATKIGINQHDILHKHFPDDCCLCKAENTIILQGTEKLLLEQKCDKIKEQLTKAETRLRESQLEIRQLNTTLKFSNITLHKIDNTDNYQDSKGNVYIKIIDRNKKQ